MSNYSLNSTVQLLFSMLIYTRYKIRQNTL